MLSKDTHRKSATCIKAKPVPVFYSTVSRIRPTVKIALVFLAPAIFTAAIGISAAHAETVFDAGSTATILAQQSAPRGGGNGAGRPPREAMEACAEQSSGSACGFIGRDGQKIPGTCSAPEANVPLACTPADRPQNRG